MDICLSSAHNRILTDQWTFITIHRRVTNLGFILSIEPPHLQFFFPRKSPHPFALHPDVTYSRSLRSPQAARSHLRRSVTTARENGNALRAVKVSHGALIADDEALLVSFFLRLPSCLSQSLLDDCIYDDARIRYTRYRDEVRTASNAPLLSLDVSRLSFCLVLFRVRFAPISNFCTNRWFWLGHK